MSRHASRKGLAVGATAVGAQAPTPTLESAVTAVVEGGLASSTRASGARTIEVEAVRPVGSDIGCG